MQSNEMYYTSSRPRKKVCRFNAGQSCFERRKGEQRVNEMSEHSDDVICYICGEMVGCCDCEEYYEDEEKENKEK